MLFGCSRNTEALRVLDDLRRDGLIDDNPREPAPIVRVKTSVAGQDNADASRMLPDDGALTLHDLLAEADQRNPQLAVARARIGMAGADAWQASLYPNPTLGVESENVRPSEGGFGVSETTVRVSQPIIVSDRRTAGVAAARKRMNAERLSLAALRREIHGKVRRVVTELLYLRQAIALREQLRALASRTVDIAETRFEARAAPESEAIRARVEANSLTIDIEWLKGERDQAAERLAVLLGGKAIDVSRIAMDQSIDRVDSVALSLDELKKAIRESHPTILAGQARVESRQQNVQLQRARRQRDITAQFGAGINHADDEGFIEAGLGVPLPVFDENQGRVLRARFEVMLAQRELQSTVDELNGAIGEAYHAWQSADTRLTQFQNQILDDAKRAYVQAKTGYEAGHLPFVDLLDAQRTLVNARIAELDLRRAAGLAAADIHAIVGLSLHLEKQQGD